jgi:hypothetical protein
MVHALEHVLDDVLRGRQVARHQPDQFELVLAIELSEAQVCLHGT